MRRPRTAIGAAMVVAASAGCAVPEVVPLDPTQGAPMTTVAALLAGNLPVPHPDVTGDTPIWPDAAPSGTVDPDALVLVFGNQPDPCKSPQIPARCAAPAVEALVVLPPDLAQLGRVELTDPRVVVYAYACYPDDPSSPCGGGGGSALGGFRAGTLEIVRADASSIAVSARGAAADWGEISDACTIAPPVPPDGSYDVPRCDGPAE